jgi:hypothetical protein
MHGTADYEWGGNPFPEKALLALEAVMSIE